MSDVSHQRRLVLGMIAASAGVLMLTIATRDAPAPAPASAVATGRPAGSPAPVQAPQRRAHIPRPCPGGDCDAPEVVESAGVSARGATYGHAPHPVDPDDDSGVSDERGHVDPALAPTPENIQAAVQAIVPEVTDCVSEWGEEWAASGAFADGRLRIELTLGPEGVREASILDVEDIPAGVATCFGAVIYEVQWPQPDHEMKISYPFHVTVD